MTVGEANELLNLMLDVWNIAASGRFMKKNGGYCFNDEVHSEAFINVENINDELDTRAVERLEDTFDYSIVKT